MSYNINDLEIRRVDSENDISAIVNLHMQIFSNNFTGTIGRRFLEFYFKRILFLPDGVIFVCKSKEKNVGFVAGLASKKGFYNLKFIILGIFVTIWQLIVRPPIFILILRHIKRMFTFSNDDYDAELLSIAVQNEFRKQGIARKLVYELERFFQSKNVAVYEVFTDMEQGQGYLFYEKLGFRLIRKVALFGLIAHLYYKDVNPEILKVRP